MAISLDQAQGRRKKRRAVKNNNKTAGTKSAPKAVRPWQAEPPKNSQLSDSEPRLAPTGATPSGLSALLDWALSIEFEPRLKIPIPRVFHQRDAD